MPSQCPLLNSQAKLWMIDIEYPSNHLCWSCCHGYSCYGNQDIYRPSWARSEFPAAMLGFAYSTHLHGNSIATTAMAWWYTHYWKENSLKVTMIYWLQGWDTYIFTEWTCSLGRHRKMPPFSEPHEFCRYLVKTTLKLGPVHCQIELSLSNKS